MASKREAQRETAIDLMCQVAIQAIGQGGYAAMTLAEVGELAGYSRGLATHHFGSKAGLLTAILDKVLEKNRLNFERPPKARRASLGWLRLLTALCTDAFKHLTKHALTSCLHWSPQRDGRPCK